jgi:3-methyladenine DNA glycosylase/8-oxoguanine DNA glycosylase
MARRSSDDASIPVVTHRALLRVPLPAPTDFSLCVQRYAVFGRDEASRLEAGALRFVRPIGADRYLVTVRGAGTAGHPVARAEVLGTAPPAPHVRARVRAEVLWRLGAPFDLPAFERLARSEPVLSGLVKDFRGYRPPLSTTPFESLVTSISAQQVNLAFAFATRSRLVSAFGPAVRTPDGDVLHAFPSPSDLAGARASRLRAMQFSGTKTRAILDLARTLRRDPALLEEAHAQEEARIHETLVAMHGIGRWTVDWFLARGLGRPDAWPAGDLGLRKAVAHFYFEGADQPEGVVRAFGERFGPHRNLAAHYLLMGYMRDRRRERETKAG